MVTGGTQWSRCARRSSSRTTFGTVILQFGGLFYDHHALVRGAVQPARSATSSSDARAPLIRDGVAPLDGPFGARRPWVR